MKTLLISLLGLLLFIFGVKNTKEFQLSDDMKVHDVLKNLGDDSSQNALKSVRNANARNGYNLVHFGFAERHNGKKTKKQSKHFVCTSCHNVVKERADLNSTDPQERLDYAVKNDLPFLQGTSLYGAANRKSFYNDDYIKKYGELTLKARNDIREAIQLCAIECAQGRELKDWEIESILAYLWEIDLKIGDLNLEDSEKQLIKNAIQEKGENNNAVDLIKSKFLDKAPATFLYPPEDRKKGLGPLGDPQNGKHIYDKSCMHCHKESRYSFFNLDDSTFSFKHLEKHIAKYSPYSIYQVARYGTSPMNGKRSYMPFYTKEKMSDQMLEDLRAYIKTKSK